MTDAFFIAAAVVCLLAGLVQVVGWLQLGGRGVFDFRPARGGVEAQAAHQRTACAAAARAYQAEDVAEGAACEAEHAASVRQGQDGVTRIPASRIRARARARARVGARP